MSEEAQATEKLTTDQGAAAAAAAAGDKTASEINADKGGEKAAAGIIGNKEAAAADDKKAAVPADWPDNWRDKMAEQLKPGDKKFRERLERIASPVDVAKSWLGLEQRLSSGELKAAVPYPEKGTDAEKAAWREAQGVPAKPEDYKIELKDGVVLGEADKPVVSEFLKIVHGKNWTNAQANDALQAYYEIQGAQTQQLADLDTQRHQENDDALRAELGTDYRRTINAVDNFLSSWPEPLVQNLLGGRLADGSKIADSALFTKQLAALALELNPTATLIPSGESGAKGVNARLEEIRKFARENPDKYDQDKAMQEEQKQLIDAQARLQARGKAA